RARGEALGPHSAVERPSRPEGRRAAEGGLAASPTARGRDAADERTERGRARGGTSVDRGEHDLAAGRDARRPRRAVLAPDADVDRAVGDPGVDPRDDVAAEGA